MKTLFGISGFKTNATCDRCKSLNPTALKVLLYDYARKNKKIEKKTYCVHCANESLEEVYEWLP